MSQETHDEIEKFLVDKIKDKFILGYVDDDGDFNTYIGKELNDLDCCYLLDVLQNRRLNEYEYSDED